LRIYITPPLWEKPFLGIFHGIPKRGIFFENIISVVIRSYPKSGHCK
jgi:hypothetical protein